MIAEPASSPLRMRRGPGDDFTTLSYTTTFAHYTTLQPPIPLILTSMSDNAAVLRQLKIKTGVAKRCVRRIFALQ